MNDRELLELAAKAAGIIGHFDKDCIRATVAGYDQGWHTCWSPLTDDGDALRLAVSIPGMDLQWIIAEAWQAHDDYKSRMAQVRRAITRAAAEIGRTM